MNRFRVIPAYRPGLEGYLVIDTATPRGAALWTEHERILRAHAERLACGQSTYDYDQDRPLVEYAFVSFSPEDEEKVEIIRNPAVGYTLARHLNTLAEER